MTSARHAAGARQEGAVRSELAVPERVIAYAPEIPSTGKPWLLELDPLTGRVRALLEDPTEAAVINVRRARCRSRTHSSLRAACDAYALGEPAQLSLRWAVGVHASQLDSIELARRTRGAEPFALVETRSDRPPSRA